MQDRDLVTVEDVEEVYRTELLGPSGQNDLVHYETRLKEALEDENPKRWHPSSLPCDSVPANWSVHLRKSLRLRQIFASASKQKRRTVLPWLPSHRFGRAVQSIISEFGKQINALHLS